MKYSNKHKEVFMQVIWSFLNTPYIFGGSDFSGLDCSGLVLEGLKAVGVVKSHDDYSAQGLWTLLCSGNEVDLPSRGDLLFWSDDSGKIYHVAIAIDDLFCITADGGTSTTITIQEAILGDAFVKVRPILHRKNAPRILNIFEK